VTAEWGATPAAEVIWKHYAGVSQDYQMPVL
jgi:hypothetical protein